MQASSLNTFGTKIINYFQKNGIFSPFVAKNPPNKILESASKFYMQDLIGEGPLAGLVDPDGYELVLFDQGQNNSEVFKGVYLNDYPIKNHITNTFNYNRLELYSRPGTEFQTYLPVKGISPDSNFLFSSPGVSYSIEKPLYGLKNEVTFGSISNSIAQNNTVSREGVGELILNNTSVRSSTHNSCLAIKRGQNIDAYNVVNFQPNIFNQNNFQQNFGAYHEIKDKNTDFLVLNLKANALYTISKNGDTNPNKVIFGIELGYKLQDDYKCFIIHTLEGIATSPYTFDLIFDISDFDFSLSPYIKVYNFSKAPQAQDSRTLLSVSSVSVTEITSLKFKYPNSCYFLTVFDSRGFPQPPNRRFDMKLLKIKVPENYDAESKTYDGYWSGEFDPVLRWSDNPAWILYDLITNQRYGLGKYSFQETLADKWSLYKIAKYCDEYVPTYNKSKFPPCSISSANRNRITVQPISGISDPKIYFPPGKMIDLFNLNYSVIGEDGENETIITNHRAIIGSVVLNGSLVDIYLIPDFGLHKIFSLFPSVKSYIQSKIGIENQYKNAKELLIQVITDSYSSTSSIGSEEEKQISDFISYIKSKSVLTQDVFDYSGSGYAACQFDNFLPLVEPRFRANISIANETEVTNLLNNVASTFKGMVYWSNDFVNFDSDKPKNPVYFFNNSNVKDGLFNYAGSSKDTRYTVAKIVYADEADGFQDKTLYVEDQINIKKYGYVEKEIIGFGITSKSQARRIGEWFLLTNQVEQELITFTAGPESLLLSPGNVISITDELKVSGRKGGRVSSVYENVITLDDKYDFIEPGDIISFIVPKESTTSKVLNQSTNLTDSSLEELSPSYLYKFEVEGVGIESNFRTQITLKISGETQERVSYINAISPSTLWVYDKDITNASTAFNKDYRIVAIKEKSPTEFEFTAAQYEPTKFQFIENKNTLSANNLYSQESNNSSEINPINLFANLDPVQQGFVSIGTKTFSLAEKYDYFISSLDYSDSSYSGLMTVIEIFCSKIYDYCLSYNSSCEGFVAEYILNSKKISFCWKKGDKPSCSIVSPKIELDISYEFLRVYMIGGDNQYLN